jgi:hypothetical protein
MPVENTGGIQNGAIPRHAAFSLPENETIAVAKSS